MEKEDNLEDKNEQDGGEEWIGPIPEEMIQPKQKKRKILQYEHLYMEKYLFIYALHNNSLTNLLFIF